MSKRPAPLPESDQKIKQARGQDDEITAYMSNVVEDRSSAFAAYFIPVQTYPKVNAWRKRLSTDPQYSIISADHKICAWRVRSNQTSLGTSVVMTTGHDDDGEKYAGKKLENMLSDMSVQGLLLVARWYGGVLLGPVRFDHIVNCAREAIQKSKLPKPKSEAAPEADGAAGLSERVKALRVKLAAKDNSIASIRLSIDDLKTKLGQAASQSSASPRKAAALPTDENALTNLLAGKDRTISSLRSIYKQLQEEQRQAELEDAAVAEFDKFEKL